MNILNFIMHNCIAKLAEVLQNVPLSNFKEGNSGNLWKFFVLECGAGVLFTAIWKRWKA